MSSLREQLLEIRAQRGVLTPEVVVEEATNPEHPLHNKFEWNDKVAGHKYRLSQAQELLRVTYVPGKGIPEVRAFWPVRDGAPSDYKPMDEVLADDVQRTLVLREMDRDWKQFRTRYQHMKEFADLVASALAEVG